MPTAAVKAQGTLLEVETTTPGTYAPVAEVTTLDWTGDSDELDVSSHSSLNGWREWIQGMKSAEVTFELNFAPNLASHGETGRGLLALFVAGTVVNMRIVWTGLTATFAAFVRSFSPSAPTDGVLTASGAIRVTGNITFS